jgi:hypothetical protein
MVLLFVFISCDTMFYCTVRLQGPKGERGDFFLPDLGVKGAPGDKGSPGLPGELVFLMLCSYLVVSCSTSFLPDGFSHRISFLKLAYVLQLLFNSQL